MIRPKKGSQVILPVYSSSQKYFPSRFLTAEASKVSERVIFDHFAKRSWRSAAQKLKLFEGFSPSFSILAKQAVERSKCSSRRERKCLKPIHSEHIFENQYMSDAFVIFPLFANTGRPFAADAILC